MRKFLIAGALLASAMSTAAFAAQQDFTVTNHTGHTIVTLNVSPNNDSHWGPDILGRQVLNNGEQAAVSFDRNEDQCSWDIKVTYDDGTDNDLRAVNLCETTEVEFTA
jgi:Flp pilus assembly protein TadG